MNNVEPFYVEVGRRIQNLRNTLGMTQEFLGNQLEPKVTRASIANIETGKQRILAHTLVQLANALGVKVEELIPSSQPKKRQVSANVESELAQKLSLPNNELKKLTAKLKSASKRKTP